MYSIKSRRILSSITSSRVLIRLFDSGLCLPASNNVDASSFIVSVVWYLYLVNQKRRMAYFSHSVYLSFLSRFGEKVKTSQVGVNPSLSIFLSLRVSSTRVSISTACIARFDPFAYPLSMVVERAARSGATSGGAGAGGCFTHTRPALGVPHHQIQALYASCLMIITEPQGTESIIMKKPRASRTIESNWVKTLLATAKNNTQCAE